MGHVVEVRALHKHYGRGTHALRGVDLTIEEGERFALLGPNGAGKSTLVRIVAGLSTRDSGETVVSGVDPGRQPRTLQWKVGVVPQENDLDPLETPESMVTFQCRLFGMNHRDARERCDELLTTFNLEPFRGKKASELSGGNKRRLHCALALVHRPRLLFLDEPTTGMDPEVRRSFWQVLLRANERDGTTLFLTTQYLEEAEQHTDSIALIHDGTILFRGSVRDFKGRVDKTGGVSLEESYLLWLKEHRRKEVACV